jgi:uncharacterized protein YbjT (DUF2867 family)
MINVLIIGANGQLGRNTTRAFLSDTDAMVTLYLRRAGRLPNPDSARVRIFDADVLDRPMLESAMRGQDAVCVTLEGDMKRYAEEVVAAMHAAATSKRLIFVTTIGIYGDVPGQTYREELDPYRDAAAVIEASDLDYTILRPARFTSAPEVSYELTQKGEPFEGREVSLNSVSDLIVKLATTPGLQSRRSIGVSRPLSSERTSTRERDSLAR